MRREAGRIAIVIVAAVAENGVIGSTGGLPWRLRSDLRHFRALTLDKPIVMGRKTFLSLGRPLDRRTNVVVSRDRAFAVPGAIVAPSFEAALTVARADARRRGTDAVMIVGGAEIYALALPVADRIEMTLVHATPAGEVWFPAFDREAWEEVARTEVAAGPADDSAHAFVRLERRSTVEAACRSLARVAPVA